MTDSHFIAIEGIEGVGKTTLSKFISTYLLEKGIDNRITREPGGTDVSEVVRELLKDPKYQIDPKTELLLMFASRAHHVEHFIKPLLSQGITVISDRYVDASYAYQGGGRGIPDADIAAVEAIACQGLRPDITILVYCPVDIAMDRVRSRALAIDRIEQEKIAFFQRAQDKYLSIAKDNDSYIVLDGSQSLDAVTTALKKQLDLRYE